MRRAVAVVFVLALAAAAVSAQAVRNVPRISIDELKPLMQSGQALVLDVRRPEEFAKGHYEQLVAGHGTVTLGDESWEVSGHGLRDHSWGPRFWQAPWYYRWLTANAGPDFGFMASRVAKIAGQRCDLPPASARLAEEDEPPGSSLAQESALLSVEDRCAHAQRTGRDAHRAATTQSWPRARIRSQKRLAFARSAK